MRLSFEWLFFFFLEKPMKLLKVFALTLALLSSGLAWSQSKVVYHISDAEAQALGGLRNVRNHLDIDPTAKITVVSHGNGVDFLMEGVKDKNGSLYAGPISALKSRGVTFEVCEVTLKNRSLKSEQFLQEADFTPSGVVRIAKLQHQGYAYIRP
jgi:intracellular sulfur oxidation DsrE/DsrF family protein